MTIARDCIVGIDIGTSGVRAFCANTDLEAISSASIHFKDLGSDRRDPHLWWLAVTDVLSQLLKRVPADRIAAVAVDGTSGTMIAVDAHGKPLTSARLYNDPCTDQSILDQISSHAPKTSAAHGVSSGLAKAIAMSDIGDAKFIQHEADWIASCLSGQTGLSDENNALKTGYDPIKRQWPDWIGRTDVRTTMLPRVLAAGTPIGPLCAKAQSATGLAAETLVVSGTTDGCASFLATGASDAGDGVTALGTTLTIKLLSNKPIFAPEYGIYSHRIGDVWLAGGASNSGGNVLARFFSSAQLSALSERIDPTQVSGFDYYPLAQPGERFPINDMHLAPRLTPRPESDSQFLHGLLEGMANIEALGYRRLAELGAPALQTVRSVGGGAQNPVWTAIRKRCLGVTFQDSISDEAAAGTAWLALKGARTAGIVSA